MEGVAEEVDAAAETDLAQRWLVHSMVLVLSSSRAAISLLL